MLIICHTRYVLSKIKMSCEKSLQFNLLNFIECVCFGSTQQLVELGDSIGYVNTGLKESEIHRCLRKISPSISHTLADRKCSICQVKSRLTQTISSQNFREIIVCRIMSL